MARSIARRLRKAILAVRADIRLLSQRGDLSGALATEGYAAGYLAALTDVDAMMTHGFPADRNHYWDEKMQDEFAEHAKVHEENK